MISRFAHRLAVAILLAATNGAFAAEPRIEIAQIYNRPPPVDEPDDAPSERDAGLAPRIDRLERQLRNMTGTIEELQHSVRVLEEQLRAARDNTRQDATRAGAPPPAAPAERHGDAFDPANSGAPRPLGQTPPSAPLTPAPRAIAAAPAREAGAPLDLTPPALKGQAQPVVIPAPEGAPAQPTVKDEYEQAVALMRAGQYESAERSLTVFLAKNSKSKYAPAATYGLGESFFLRGRHREAAERYLEISTKFPQSAQAPDAMLRLGQSLAALGAREQACASFTEIGVKYPGSPTRVRDAAQRESKKLQC
jgi:tol-pal system protein YbgF